jgi:hypothetical protein
MSAMNVLRRLKAAFQQSNEAMDFDGNEVILDADADTSITADTDDQIDVKINGADEYVFTASTFDLNGNVLVLDEGGGTRLDASAGGLIDVYIDGGQDFTFESNSLVARSGSNIKADTLAETTAANGVDVDGALIRDGIVWGAQANPTAETGAATISVADIISGIVTITHSIGVAVPLTLDTGTNMDAGDPAAIGTDRYRDWSIINLSAAAADTATLTASAGHTIVGNAVIQSAHATTGALYGNSARFRSRRAATNTWITYRIA